MRPFALALCLLVAACSERRDPRVITLDEGWEETAAAMRVRLPPAIPPDAHLVFRAYAGEIEIVAAGKRIYQFQDADARGHLTTHDVMLPAFAAGEWLELRFPADAEGSRIGGAPVIVPAAAAARAIAGVTTAPLRGDIGRIAIGMILLVIGIACIAISRLRARGNAAALLLFGIFAALYGLRILTSSSLPLLLGASIVAMRYATAVITYIIPIPGWQMVRALIGDGWKGTLRWQVFAFAAFAPIGIVSDIVQKRPISLDSVNNVLVIIGGINIIGNLVIAARRDARDVQVLLAGSLFFLLAAFNNNLSSLRLVPWRAFDETFGFVVFVACLGYASMRAFARGERQRVSIEGELATAREIQRSILPARMPALPGLRFDVRYDPASSVAGDLYDFISLDGAGTGVLVADVAGHGVPAALIASMVKIAASSSSRMADDPAAMLTSLSETLRRDVRRAFVTATYLYFDVRQHTVAVANAGHAPPLLFRDGTIRELGRPGVLMGRFGETRYETEQMSLVACDRIVAWTDGIVEARNKRGESFGEERLHELAVRGASADTIVDAVLGWRTDENVDDADDLTIVIVDVAH